jgi:Cohesin domain
MTMLRWTLILFMSFLTGITTIQAQVKPDSAYIFLPDVQAQQGNVLIIPVKITTSDLFLGVQFSMNWDSTMLQYQGVSDFGLNKMTLADNFGALGASGGQLRFLWFDQSSVGVPAQNKLLFNVKLKVIGNNASTLLKITGNPATIEVSNVANKDMKVGLKEAKINIGKVGVNDFDLSETTLHEASPNPMGQNGSKIRLDIAQEDQVNINIFDISGKNIFHINNFYNIGTHFVELSRSQFPQAGLYLYQVTTHLGKNLSGKLIIK